MKTKEELESLKKEMAQLKSKLVELTDDELAIVTGGLHNLESHNVTPDYEIRRGDLNVTDPEVDR